MMSHEEIQLLEEHFNEEIKRVDDVHQSSLRSVLSKFSSCLKLTNMSTIDICGSRDVRLNDFHVEYLVVALKRSRIVKLQHVKLQNHHISDNGFIKLCQLVSLEDGGGLLTLDLEGNAITEKSSYSINECLIESDYRICTLETLNLSWNPIKELGGIQIANALERNSHLRRLLLANCDLNLRAVIAIATSVCLNRTLEELVLDRPLLTTLEDEGVDHLARMLSRQESMSSLSLRYHRIGDYATKLLSEALFRNESLTSLNLECNRISVGGANALAKNLITNNRLHELRLSANMLSDEGARAMAEALKTNVSLKVLTLKNNDIGVSGLIALGMALDCNNTLQQLTLWGNNFDNEAGNLYHDLARLRFPYVGLAVDIEVYIVDGNYLVSEKAME